jgi:hypothetical protein
MPYTVSNSARITTDAQKNYLAALAKKIPFSFHVTSGTRNAEQQARAMFTKIELGDNLILIYKDDSFAQGVIDAYPDLAKATQFVQSYYDNSKGSTHGNGMAVDLRTRNLSTSQINQLVTAAKELGSFTLVEKIPPHLHIRIPDSFAEKKILRYLIPLTLLIIFGVQFRKSTT